MKENGSAKPKKPWDRVLIADLICAGVALGALVFTIWQVIRSLGDPPGAAAQIGWFVFAVTGVLFAAFVLLTPMFIIKRARFSLPLLIVTAVVNLGLTAVFVRLLWAFILHP